MDIETQFIAKIDKLKYRLQQVITILPSAGDVQHQVEFGRSGPASMAQLFPSLLPTASDSHWLMISFTLAW